MPMTMPELLEFGFGIHPGMETFVSVMPEMTHALETIHKFSYHTRQCYLNDDRDLFFFKNYTFLNCFQECVSNYTQKVGYEVKSLTCRKLQHDFVFMFSTADASPSTCPAIPTRR